VPPAEPKRRADSCSRLRIGEPRRSERRERRSPLAVLLRVCGFSASGRLFSEIASTRNISPAGCCVRLRTRPLAQTTVAVQVIPRDGPVPEGGSQMLYQVAWVAPQGQSWDVGLLALSDRDLLRVAFASFTP
jgi:PilZ domain